jgi:hypothetical protein
MGCRARRSRHGSVLSPPRKRPVAWSSPAFRARRRRAGGHAQSGHRASHICCRDGRSFPVPTWPSRMLLIRSHWLSRSPKRRLGQSFPTWRVSRQRPGNSGLSPHARDASPQLPRGDAILQTMHGRSSPSSLPDTMAPARGRVIRLGAQRPQRVRRMQIIALLVAISSPKRGRAPVC